MNALNFALAVNTADQLGGALILYSVYTTIVCYWCDLECNGPTWPCFFFTFVIRGYISQMFWNNHGPVFHLLFENHNINEGDGVVWIWVNALLIQYRKDALKMLTHTQLMYSDKSANIYVKNTEKIEYFTFFEILGDICKISCYFFFITERCDKD